MVRKNVSETALLRFEKTVWNDILCARASNENRTTNTSRAYHWFMLEIVLYQPEIPHNTGSVARTCAILGARLHLIRPFGFILSDQAVKRSGMDYLTDTEIIQHTSWQVFEQSLPASARVVALSGSGSRIYSHHEFQRGDYLVFGRESDGLPTSLLESYLSLRIPMPGQGRSINLAVSVGIVAFEAARQITANWLE
jgi:tRNA (cytidine/uridine-2'-O-)-methyltransferase